MRELERGRPACSLHLSFSPSLYLPGKLLPAAVGRLEDRRDGDALSIAVGGGVGGVEVAEALILIPAEPDVLPPVGDDLRPVAPGVQVLLANSHPCTFPGLWPGGFPKRWLHSMNPLPGSSPGSPAAVAWRSYLRR